MAQTVEIAGATYADVPGIEVAKSGGGTAYFPDTSGDTVTAAKLKQGETAHDANGDPITGTYQPSSQTKSVTPTFSSQTISPDSGTEFLLAVTVGAIPVTYTQNAAGGTTVTIG